MLPPAKLLINKGPVPSDAGSVSVLVPPVPEGDVAVPAALQAHLLREDPGPELVLLAEVDKPVEGRKIYNPSFRLQHQQLLGVDSAI